SPTLAAGLAHPNRIRHHLHPTTGPGAALNGQLHASPRLPPGSAGPKQPPESTSRWIKVGGNVITLLEYRPTKTDDCTIIAREGFWKNALLTRTEFDYNKN